MTVWDVWPSWDVKEYVLGILFSTGIALSGQRGQKVCFSRNIHQHYWEQEEKENSDEWKMEKQTPKQNQKTNQHFFKKINVHISKHWSNFLWLVSESV